MNPAVSQDGDASQVLDPSIVRLMPSGRQVYDALMAGIEPELVSANLPLLTEQYQSETPEANAARMERYKQAFAKYDQVYAKWLSGVQAAVLAKRADAFQKAEIKSEEADKQFLEELEQQFTPVPVQDSAPPTPPSA